MNNNSGVNTILLVVILAIIVGLGVWYFKDDLGAAREDDNDFNLNVDLPNDEAEDNTR